MVYSTERKREILDEGIIDGFHYIILNLGWHPTAYVEIPKNHPYYKAGYDDIDIDIEVHGGLTYSGDMGKDGEWYLGWDYAHCEDYFGCVELYREALDLPEWTPEWTGKKWTTEEILEDVKTAIRQLKEVR